MGPGFCVYNELPEDPGAPDPDHTEHWGWSFQCPHPSLKGKQGYPCATGKQAF